MMSSMFLCLMEGEFVDMRSSYSCCLMAFRE